MNFFQLFFSKFIFFNNFGKIFAGKIFMVQISNMFMNSLLDSEGEIPTPTEEVIDRSTGGEIKINIITYIALSLIFLIIVAFFIWKFCPFSCCRNDSQSDDIDLDNDSDEIAKANLKDDIQLNIEAP